MSRELKYRIWVNVQEKFDCKNFFRYMVETHPAFAASNENKLNIMSICAKQKQVYIKLGSEYICISVGCLQKTAYIFQSGQIQSSYSTNHKILSQYPLSSKKIIFKSF
jgi:hypothetical protein